MQALKGTEGCCCELCCSWFRLAEGLLHYDEELWQQQPTRVDVQSPEFTLHYRKQIRAMLIPFGADLEVVVGEVNLRQDCRQATGIDLSTKLVVTLFRAHCSDRTK